MRAIIVGVWFMASVPAPEPVVSISLIPKLEGTTWKGDGVVAPTVYLFDRQDGDSLYWEANNKYCEFKGKVRGEEINGRAWNVAGGKWALRFQLQRDKIR